MAVTNERPATCIEQKRNGNDEPTCINVIHFYRATLS